MKKDKQLLDAFSRSELLLGRQSIEKLNNCRVAVFGIGGVGSYAVEGLVRTGVGKFLLVDNDVICLTNINRQIHATRKTVGKLKTDVMRDRILEINPQAEVVIINRFYMAKEKGAKATMQPVENSISWDELLEFYKNNKLDYIVDAIDTISAKIDLIVNAQNYGIPIISCMGVGNKLDPTRLEVADIYSTSVCPLARVMRRELIKRDVKSLKVVYSKEKPITPLYDESNDCTSNCICPKQTTHTCTIRRSTPGSVAYMPSVAGLIIAAEVIKDLVGLTANESE